MMPQLTDLTLGFSLGQVAIVASSLALLAFSVLDTRA